MPGKNQHRFEICEFFDICLTKFESNQIYLIKLATNNQAI